VAFLEIAGITKRFGGLVALNAISFSVDKGEIVGIIGPNGAGKTTLFGVISGFIPPSEGHVTFDGEAITGISPDRLVRRGLMRSFQIVQTFADMTTLDVVTTAALTRRPMREAVDYAADALKRVGLGGKELMTPLTLSLQDKKLLELAKCIATDPSCILLDEVMAGLTMAETAAPLAIIRELNAQGVTIVMVEHVMPVIMRLATRIVVINFGEKIAEATPEDIIRDQRVVDAYFGDSIDA
jgi:branched-chain amino acid transport system ATP-binding protein